jgi:two-component sensor histidine kinase
VHQKLYQGTNLGAIEMKDYFLNLSESILDSFGIEERIDLKLEMKPLDLDIDTAIPLGLIINELMTNSLKYAFPNREKGTITIKLEKINHILHLEFSDNGVGKSGTIKGTGFGAQLVSLLTQQLNGKMLEENQNGTKMIFDFKV